jgi:MFS transporter, PAT family, beta-lactamase induction signal transducer AmpG
MTENSQPKKSRNPWAWIPSLYFYQGIPYSIVMITSGLIYKTMGVSIATFAFWTSLLYLPWAIKPLWSPYIDVVSTKRNWILWTQLLLGIAFIAAGFAMQLPFYFPITIAVFAVIAISSASHDIAADGFYMLSLDQHKQAFFVGIRSTFYRFAMLTALGLLPLIAGLIQENTGLDPVSFEVNSVPAAQYKAADVTGFMITKQEGTPKILIYPEKVQVPIFEKGVSNLDSAVVFVALSAPPVAGETIVVNMGRKSGSKDIDLSKNQSGRFEFTSENWNKPVAATLRVDHNLTNQTNSQFRATAGNIAFSWTVSLGALGIVLILLAVYHRIILPRPVEAKEKTKVDLKVYGEVFASFFTKPGIIPALIFFLMYRLGEAQLVKVATPFLVDSRNSGGIGLTSAQYGIAYGTLGMICLTIGGILGGVVASKYGLKKMIWVMALAMNIPISVYIYLSTFQPVPGDITIYIAIAAEQMGYGFGFTAYMLYMLSFVGESKFKTAEFAIGTSLMALGMMIPGMISGYMKELLGYQHFFIYVMICAIPGIIAIKFLRIDPTFGIKKKEEAKV